MVSAFVRPFLLPPSLPSRHPTAATGLPHVSRRYLVQSYRIFVGATSASDSCTSSESYFTSLTSCSNTVCAALADRRYGSWCSALLFSGTISSFPRDKRPAGHAGLQADEIITTAENSAGMSDLKRDLVVVALFRELSSLRKLCMFATFSRKRLETAVMSKPLKSASFHQKSCQLAAMRWRVQVYSFIPD